MKPPITIYESAKYTIDQWGGDAIVDVLRPSNEPPYCYVFVCVIPIELAIKLKSDADIEKYLVLA